MLIPALEIDTLGLAGRLDKAEDLGVVRRGELKIGDPDLHMGQSQDGHQVCTFMNRSLSSPS